MSTRVAFVRAVNVGRRKLPNAELRAAVADLGYGNVWTYINSGNVVFDATGPRAELERRITGAVEAVAGFEATTFVRSATELRRALDETPFEVGAGDTYFLTFLAAVATAAQARDLEALSNDFDRLVVRGRDVHWLMHGKSLDTSVDSAAWSAVIGVHRSTSRNVNSLRKLVTRLDG